MSKSTSEYDEAIINSPSPFTRNRYDRRHQIDNFVGRDRELEVLADMLANAITSDTSFGVKISGPGGSGKSTLFGYFSQMIKSGEIFTRPYCKIDKNDVKIKISFIDAPKGELMSIRFFWRSMILSWGQETHDFLEFFAASFILKALVVLWEDKFNQDGVEHLLAMLNPNLDEALKRHTMHEIFDLDLYAEKLLDLATHDPNFLAGTREVVYRGFRVLQKHAVTLPTSRTIQLRIEKAYFDNLFDTLHGEFEVQSQAKNRLIGETDELFKSDDQVITLVNWFIDTWCWIEEKQACFVIGIDNIGYMTVESDNKALVYSSFLQTLLQLRDRMKSFLFVLIGTTEDWEGFNRFVNSSKDYPAQLAAFFMQNLELVRLNEAECKQALTLLITSFWIARKKSFPPGNPCYPFAPDFFSYLYGLTTHDYREILNWLHQVWTYYKNGLKVVPLADAFEMIRFTHFVLKGEPKRDLTFSSLIPWERDHILSWFKSIDSSFKAKDQSAMVENALKECFDTLMAEENPRQIRLVSKSSIDITKDDDTTCKRIPDVYVELDPLNTFDARRAFEIQVKMHEPKKEVKLSEIESSLDLLAYSKTDALLFVMTGPGLEARAVDRIKELGLQERVLHAQPLDPDGLKALAFLCAYSHLAGEKPSVLTIKDALGILFKDAWTAIVDKIRNIGAYRANVIAAEAEQKAQVAPTMDRFMADSVPAGDGQETAPPVARGTGNVPVTSLPAKPPKNIKPGKLAARPTKQRALPSLVNCPPGTEEGEVPASGELGPLFQKYGGVLKELEFIMSETLKRRDRYKGRITRPYLKERVPTSLNDEDVTRVFGMLEKDAQKGGSQLLFIKDKTSLEITDIGRKFFDQLVNA